MKKLERLTKKQEGLIPIIRDKWINKFFETKKIDEEKFEKGIEWVYNDLLNKPKPKVVYCESWISALICIHLYKCKNTTSVRASVRDSVRDSVGDSVWDSVWDSVGDSVRDSVGDSVWVSVGASVRDSVWDSVRDSVGDSVWDSVRDSVWDSVRDSVGDSVWDSVWDSVRDSVGDSVWDSVWDSVRDSVGDYSGYISSYDNFYWLSFYDFFNEIGVLNNSELDSYKKLIESGVFQCYEYENIVFAIQPPKTILRNDNEQMNSIENKAFEWSDGCGFYYINGQQIPEDIFLKVKNKTITVEDFFNIKNEETKSAIIGMIDQIDGNEGIYRFFKDNLTEVDTYVDDKLDEYKKGTTNGMNIGVYTLFKGVINNENVSYIRCYCPSTDRMFFLGVDPLHNKANDAIASLYRVPKVLKNEIKEISRQGERFVTKFTDNGLLKLKNNELTKSELEDLVSLSGEEYFKLMSYEY